MATTKMMMKAKAMMLIGKKNYYCCLFKQLIWNKQKDPHSATIENFFPRPKKSQVLA
jgi:hypothetical protein